MADVQVERDVPAQMRDGTVLRADVYRPAGSGRFPILLRRTCYSKERLAIGDPYALARRGYVVVLQDARGRHRSEGEWSWGCSALAQTVEAQDGYDSVEWAAELPGSDGRVATWGHSFDAWCQWRAAELQPPHLAGMSASGITVRMMDWTHGIFETGRRLQWAYTQSVDVKHRANSGPIPEDVEQARRMWDEMERGKWLWALPLGQIPRRVFGPFTNQLLRHYQEIDQEYFNLDQVHPKVHVPVLVFTGWWDRLNGAVDHYSGLVENGPPEIRDSHRLVVGPWSHSPADLARKIGPLDHGPAAGETHENLVARFFDHHLKGIANGLGSEPPVKLFTLNRNEWRFEHEWPLERTTYTEFFLHSGGRANTVRGDGGLSTTAPGREPMDSYVYDPRDPVMSLMDMASQAAPRDQSPLDDREDVLVFQTERLETPLEVTGPVVMKLWAISDAPDTDWTVKLVDVRPDGLAINLASGIVRARYRDGYDAPSAIEPGNPYEYEIKLGPVSVLFEPGHRIRLDLSSSDFPNFDRNHNTFAPFWSDAELRVAHQTILHDDEYPSRLILPIV